MYGLGFPKSRNDPSDGHVVLICVGMVGGDRLELPTSTV
jgi:hypothetical protein